MGPQHFSRKRLQPVANSCGSELTAFFPFKEKLLLQHHLPEPLARFQAMCQGNPCAHYCDGSQVLSHKHWVLLILRRVKADAWVLHSSEVPWRTPTRMSFLSRPWHSPFPVFMEFSQQCLVKCFLSLAPQARFEQLNRRVLKYFFKEGHSIYDPLGGVLLMNAVCVLGKGQH